MNNKRSRILLAIVVATCALTGIGCGTSEPTCEECLARQSAQLDPDGCWPYCDGEDPGEPVTEWSGTATATPIIIARDPQASQPLAILASKLFTVSGSGVVGLCDQPIFLSNGCFRSASGTPCWANMTLPAFLASDSPDTWSACDGTTVTLHSLDIYHRNMGTVLYMEGGATITGCGRSWTTVLFQVNAVRR